MYTLQLHKTITLEKWLNFGAYRQLCMIGNELNRLANGLSMGQSFDELRVCMERAFELIDLTINCQNNSLRRELLRWRDLFAELYISDETQFKNSREEIKRLLRALLLLNSDSAALVQ